MSRLFLDTGSSVGLPVRNWDQSGRGWSTKGKGEAETRGLVPPEKAAEGRAPLPPAERESDEPPLNLAVEDPSEKLGR